MELQQDFLAGRYREAADLLLRKEESNRKLSAGEFVSLLGALSFLSRMEEAEDYFAIYKKWQGLSLLAARFFLAIGWIRRSNYETARKLLAQNAAYRARSPLEKFFQHQGEEFYLYYTGRTPAALQEAEKSRRAAMATKSLFARALAIDALGHCHVVAGEIHKGLNYLTQASQLAKRLGNTSSSGGFAISRELYEAEYGLTGDAALSKLEQRLVSAGVQDYYSLSNVAIELARQYTLRGRFREASAVLEKAAPEIYTHQNRRHEIRLNLRLAELAYRRGDFFQARHFLWFVRRLLHAETDASFELGRKSSSVSAFAAASTSVGSSPAPSRPMSSPARTRTRS